MLNVRVRRVILLKIGLDPCDLIRVNDHSRVILVSGGVAEDRVQLGYRLRRPYDPEFFHTGLVDKAVPLGERQLRSLSGRESGIKFLIGRQWPLALGRWKQDVIFFTTIFPWPYVEQIKGP